MWVDSIGCLEMHDAVGIQSTAVLIVVVWKVVGDIVVEIEYGGVGVYIGDDKCGGISVFEVDVTRIL